MSSSSRRGFLTLALLAIISTTLCTSIGSVSAFSGSSELPSQPEGYALHVLTPAEADFAYIRREIAPVAVEDSSEYLVELWVKVTRFSPLPAGVVFLFDLADQAGSVRYSVRLTNDRGVMFYYPHGQSSAAFIARDVWEPGWWYSYAIRHRGPEARFYVNQSLVGSSESTSLEALGGGFTIVRISRFGEPDSGHIAFEGFADSVGFLVNGAPIFLEDFEAGLQGYDVFKSEGAVLEVISPLAYSTLTLIARPTLVSAGGSVTLVGWFRDSSNFGVANRTIYLEYSSGDGVWTVLGTVMTGLNGSFTYGWKLPAELRGQIALRARFLGDAEYQASESDILHVSIKPSARLVLDSRYLLLAILAIVVSAILVLKRTVETKGILASGFLLTGSLYSFFALITIINSMKLEYYLAYQRSIIEITIFSASEDMIIWLISSIALLLLLVALRFVCRIKLPRSLLLASLTLLISAILRFVATHEILTALLFAAGFTIILIGILCAQTILFMPKRKAASIYVLGLLVILLSIELGSSLAWVYNSFDPHYPFDSDARWILPSVETQLFNIAYGANSLLLLMLLFAWILIPILKTVLLRFSGGLGSAVFWDQGESGGKKDRFCRRPSWLKSLSRFGPKLLLFLSFILAVYLVYYPYFYEKRLLGVDTARFYYPKLLEMNDWESVRVILIGEARAPYLLLLFCLKMATGLDDLSIVKIGPALPAVLLAMSSYMFLRVGTKDEWLAAVGSTLSVFSIHTTVGMFAGIFSNWLAMSEVMLFFASFFKGSEAGYKSRWTALAVVIGFLLLFTHGWTWGVVMAVAATYLLFTLFRWRLGSTRRFELKREFAFAFIVLVFCTASVLLVFLGLSLFPSSVGAIAAVSSGYTEVLGSMSLSFLRNVWAVVVFTITYYVGGFFGNPLIYLLGLLGVFRLSRVGSPLSRILFSWLALVSAGSVLMDSWYQWRLLYLLPFQVFALFGLQILVDIAGILSIDVRRSHRGGGSSLLLKFLLVLVVLLSLFNYTLRSLNYLIPS